MRNQTQTLVILAQKMCRENVRKKRKIDIRYQMKVAVWQSELEVHFYSHLQAFIAIIYSLHVPAASPVKLNFSDTATV